MRSANPLWAILHAPGFVLNTPTPVVFVARPLLPWIGLTAAGYGLGRVYGWTVDRRRRFLLWMGLGLSAAFAIVRAAHLYGDPSRWSFQESTLFVTLSFLNTTKYPPSLLFLLMTLGPALLFLRAVDGGTPRAPRRAIIIDRVPRFYDVLHFSLIHALAVAASYARFGSAHWTFESPDLAHYPFSAPPGRGFSLCVVYLAWAPVVVAMYPLCRWFAGVKARRAHAWLSYL